MEFVKFELVAANIMDIRKHMVMWLDCEISSAIFCCGFTVRVAWPLVWIDSLVVSWPFTEKKNTASRIYRKQSFQKSYKLLGLKDWYKITRLKTRLIRKSNTTMKEKLKLTVVD